jgi:hypothetical protein
MSRRHSSIKIGMLPVLALVVALCLFVLAVLALTTAQAAAGISERQAQATTEAYEVESAAQQLVGEVDGVLLLAANSGAEGLEAAAALVASEADELVERVQGDHPDVELSCEVQGEQLFANLEGPNGRHLTIILRITDTMSYEIVRWDLTTVQAHEGNANQLWSGM